MFSINRAQLIFVALMVGLLSFTPGFAAAAVRIEGQVQVGGGPLASSTVTLWAASAGEPQQLAQATSGSDGRFELRTPDTPGEDAVLYVIAKGGVATVKKGGGDDPGIVLLTVLGNTPPAKIVVNELTTVASTITSARFIKGEAISGNPLGLRIAAGNAPNLVDPATGGWGKVLLDPLNSSMTTTLAKLDTLGSLISAYATVANDDWRARFLKAATPTGGVATNGDVWIADGSDDQLLFFPGGRIKDGRIVKVAGLKSPFDIVIDSQNRVWVANSSSDTVVRFPANDPTKVESFRAGIGVRALALDSKENVWVASNMDLRTPQPKLPDGISIMEQFKLVTEHMVKYIEGPPAHVTGAVNMIRPDGAQPAPEGFTGPAESIPWGLNIDGNDDVWVGNMWGRSAALLAGDNTAGHPPGTKAGDVIHIFQSGSIQMITDVSIDPAGNVWVANNWNSLEAAAKPDPSRPTSTWGGGSGFTVIYGVAAPVKPPRIGKVQGY